MGLRSRTIGPMYWLALWAVDFFSLIRFALCLLPWPRARRDVRILVYHDVVDASPEEDPYRISVPPALFERQIRFLSENGYRFLSVEEAAGLLSRSEVPDRAVVVTFDDGYESVLRAAAPVLNRYAVPATLFVAVEHIGQPRFPWSPPDGRFTRPLNWDELATLVSAARLEIGSHTMTHRRLHTLSGAEQDAELGPSRRTLETRLGRQVRVFAYPFGGWDTFPDELHPRLHAHGYIAACTNVMGANLAGADLLALRRVRIGWNDNLWRLRLKLAGAYDWSDRARRLLASLRSGIPAKVQNLENV